MDLKKILMLLTFCGLSRARPTLNLTDNGSHAHFRPGIHMTPNGSRRASFGQDGTLDIDWVARHSKNVTLAPRGVAIVKKEGSYMVYSQLTFDFETSRPLTYCIVTGKSKTTAEDVVCTSAAATYQKLPEDENGKRTIRTTWMNQNSAYMAVILNLERNSLVYLTLKKNTLGDKSEVLYVDKKRTFFGLGRL